MLTETEVVGRRRSYHSKESDRFSIGSPLWPLHYRSNQQVTLGQNFGCSILSRPRSFMLGSADSEPNTPRNYLRGIPAYVITTDRRTICRTNRQDLQNIWEFVYFVWGLSPLKRRVVRWRNFRNFARRRVQTMCKTSTGFVVVVTKNKKAVLPQGNRAMPQVFFSVEVRQQHSLQV